MSDDTITTDQESRPLSGWRLGLIIQKRLEAADVLLEVVDRIASEKGVEVVSIGARRQLCEAAEEYRKAKGFGA